MEDEGNFQLDNWMQLKYKKNINLRILINLLIFTQQIQVLVQHQFYLNIIIKVRTVL
jgi:hypothetical protein